MELFIAFMYLVGIGVMICFMCNIKRLADRLFPLPEKETTRQRGHAERMAEEINRDKYSTAKRECQAEWRESTRE